MRVYDEDTRRALAAWHHTKVLRKIVRKSPTYCVRADYTSMLLGQGALNLVVLCTLTQAFRTAHIACEGLLDKFLPCPFYLHPWTHTGTIFTHWSPWLKRLCSSCTVISAQSPEPNHATPKQPQDTSSHPARLWLPHLWSSVAPPASLKLCVHMTPVAWLILSKRCCPYVWRTSCVHQVVWPTRTGFREVVPQIEASVVDDGVLYHHVRLLQILSKN